MWRFSRRIVILVSLLLLVSGIWPWGRDLLLSGNSIAFAEPTNPVQDEDNIKQLIDALVRKGMAQNKNYRATGWVPDKYLMNSNGTSGDPDAVLDKLGKTIKEKVTALSLEAKREDANYAQAIAASVSVGPKDAEEFTQQLKNNVLRDLPWPQPEGMILSIPGVTQIQYNYKGMSNGPEIRMFKIRGHVEITGQEVLLNLEMDGDVEGDKNLPIEYTVNYRTDKSRFPAWSPFLKNSGKVRVSLAKSQNLVTLSPTADFSEKGTHRNGVKPWQEYEYTWHAQKVGAYPDDNVKQNGTELDASDYCPLGGDWVGAGWGTETRFKQTRKEFVTQVSPIAGTAVPTEAGEGVLMSLNVKHYTTYYFHIDYNGNVTGRGVIIYTLDPNLCGVATLVRQVNEQVNLMKYLPTVYQITKMLGEKAVSRFNSKWAPEPNEITSKMNEYISKLPPKIDPGVGMTMTGSYRDSVKGVMKLPLEKNVAVIEAEIGGYSNKFLLAVSGEKQFPNAVPITPKGQWVFKSKLYDALEPGWRTAITSEEARQARNFCSEKVLLEHLHKELMGLPEGGTGVIKIFTERLPCGSCMGIIEQFIAKHEFITVLVSFGAQ